MAETPTVRKYQGSDANLIQQANLNKTLLNDNLALFTAEDSTIDNAYVLAYATDIQEAETEEVDELVEDTLSQKTALVKAAEKAVARKVAQVRYYVLEAFPGNREIQMKFGLDAWDKARKSQVNTLQFLTKMHSVATEYEDELTAAGFGATRIASIQTARQALETADSSQELYRSGRPYLTALRIIEYNEVYDRLTRINSLAQIVFVDDYEMRKQFVFDPAGPGNDDTEYTGTVQSQELKTIATLTYDATRSITLENTGGPVLAFYLRVDESTPSGNQRDVAEGDEPVNVTMEDLNTDPTATVLAVESKVGSEPATYKVTVG